MSVTAASVVSRSDGWLSARVGDELVLMAGQSGVYISLSDTAGRIWEILESPRAVDELCRELAEEYEVTVDDAGPEVLAFLDQLSMHQAIHVQSPTLA